MKKCRFANYSTHYSQHVVVLRDLGPWDLYPTITNSAEHVVAHLADSLHGRRLEYYDSEGVRTRLLVVNGKFAGFAVLGTAKGER